MKIVLILSSLILILSCNSQTIGLYIGDFDSGVKHMSSSTMKLKKDNKFELTYSRTSLEFAIPSTTVIKIKGSYKKENDQLILFQETSQTNWLSYGKNSDSLNMNPNGARRTALVVIDTSYGNIQIIEEYEPIKFNLTNKQNSIYIWNDDNCYVTFINSDTSNDLKNYCSEIRMKYDTTSNKR